MLPAAIATEAVTRLRASTTTDAHANVERSWASPATLTIEDCSVQTSGGPENLTARNSVEWRAKWFGNPDADVKPTDRIVHRGITHEVDGAVPLVTDPTGLLDHKWCFLRRVEG
jgi:hypothetical protein